VSFAIKDLKRLKGSADRKYYEELFAMQCRAHKLPSAERELAFHPERKWRFDFCWPNLFSPGGIALEIEGGIWMRKGAHNTGMAITRDIEKTNAATELGWRVFRATAAMVESGETVELMKRVLAQ